MSSLASECPLPVCAEMANYRDWDLDQEEVYLLTQIIEIESVAHALRMLSFVVTHMDHAVSMMEGASAVGMEHIRAVRAAKERIIEVRASLDNIRWELHGQLVTLYRTRGERRNTSQTATNANLL